MSDEVATLAVAASGIVADPCPHCEPCTRCGEAHRLTRCHTSGKWRGQKICAMCQATLTYHARRHSSSVL